MDIKKAVVRRNITAYLLILGVILIGIAAFFRYTGSPVNPFSVTKIVDIPKGAGFPQVTEILHNADMVGNRPFF